MIRSVRAWVQGWLPFSLSGLSFFPVELLFSPGLSRAVPVPAVDAFQTSPHVPLSRIGMRVLWLLDLGPCVVADSPLSIGRVGLRSVVLLGLLVGLQARVQLGSLGFLLSGPWSVQLGGLPSIDCP